MPIELDQNLKMKFIYDAIENGLTVKKVNENTYEFTKTCFKNEIKNEIKKSNRSISVPLTKKDNILSLISIIKN